MDCVCKRGRLALVLWLGLWVVPAARAVDVTAGTQWALVCGACHSMAEGEAHKTGPNLWGIVGRAIGGAEGYTYSPALANRGGAWTPAALDQYLASPADYIPGNKMYFQGIADREARAALVAYLSTLKPGNAGPMVSESGFDYGGLPQGEGRREVYSRCSVCHSLMIVKQQGMSQERWDETLDWMIDEQGMDALSAEERARILRYLAEHYGE